MVFLQLSQSQLTLIEQCPRKFQYIYLDQLMAPIPPDQREQLTRGSQVHHLMQQHELHLPQDALVSLNGGFSPQEQSSLYQMVDALSMAVPRTNDSTVFRQSEYRLSLDWSGVVLTVIYDLLLLDTAQAHILDWKTSLRPPNREQLSHHWQTKLYPFVLVETSDYLPDSVDISYWFVKRHDMDCEKGDDQDAKGDNPFHSECLTFPYNDRFHAETKHELAQIITKLHAWVDDYQKGISLPQVEVSQGHCSQCQFRMRCERMNKEAQDARNDLDDISSIPEISPTLQ